MVATGEAVLALLTGIVAGAVFRYVGVPVPAPPTLSGVLGIVGIYLGYTALDHYGIGIDLLGAL